MKYQVVVVWQETAVVLIEADSLDAALEDADSWVELPEQGEYVSDSCLIDHDASREINK